MWGSDEVKLLWELDAQGLSTHDIGVRMGRSEASIMVKKAKTRELAHPIFLCYYEEGTGKLRVVSGPYDLDVTGHPGRFNKIAQKMVRMQPRMIIFTCSEKEVAEWESGESMR